MYRLYGYGLGCSSLCRAVDAAAQVGDGKAESFGDFGHAFDTGVAGTALDVSDVSAVKASVLSQVTLGEAFLVSPGFDISAEFLKHGRELLEKICRRRGRWVFGGVIVRRVHQQSGCTAADVGSLVVVE